MSQNAISNRNNNTPSTNSWQDVGGSLLFGLGLVLLPHLPDFIHKILDIPNQIMANGYGCHVKKGNLEVRFGKDVSYRPEQLEPDAEATESEEVVQNE